MIKRIFLILLVATPLTLFAQEKYAYVNYQEVLYKMPEMGEMEKKMVATQEAIRKNAQSIEAEYQQKLKVLQEDTLNMTQSIMQTRYQELEQIQQRYEIFMQNSQQEVQQQQQSLMAPIQQKLQKAVQDVGSENNYTYIFDTGTLIYKNPKLTDATKQVKTKLGITD